MQSHNPSLPLPQTRWFLRPVTTQQGPQAAQPIHGPPSVHTLTHAHTGTHDKHCPGVLRILFFCFEGTHVATLTPGNPTGPPSKPCPPRARVCTASPAWQASRSVSALCTQTPQTRIDSPCVCMALGDGAVSWRASGGHGCPCWGHTHLPCQPAVSLSLQALGDAGGCHIFHTLTLPSCLITPRINPNSLSEAETMCVLAPLTSPTSSPPLCSSRQSTPATLTLLLFFQPQNLFPPQGLCTCCSSSSAHDDLPRASPCHSGLSLKVTS